MGGLLLFMVLGGAAYYAVRMRRNNDIHGSLSARVSELTSQLGQLREAQWKMRTAIDSLREEQDFRNQLATPSDKEQ
jgi:hypothetical protein